MHYILEAAIVGIYAAFIYCLLLPFSIANKYILFFVVGFFKHFFAYFIGIQTYYCNNGYACCSDSGDNIKILNTTPEELFIESIFEGIAFIIFCLFFSQVAYLRNNCVLLFFAVGFSLHIIFEIIGIHKYLCRVKCSPIL